MKSIFIVDDSPTILMSLKTNLEMHGFKVETASDGQDAVNKLNNGANPDLIITDLNMPRMDGFKLIEHVRQMRTFRFKPILVLTTESQLQKRQEAKRLGATGWLVKPVSGNDLIKVIRKVLPGA
ncbi:MAG: response regulator [Deltaproteobacteria bacterium]|nr:MAG: response regulator [Deltaproteobacteria bacterium]